ncbi:MULTISPECIES: CdaR family transcriptional regulator [Actinobacillus]|nr:MULTISPECIES: sugar diacid recognition domain-containing protein [Actinobacillus]WGE32898.1 helix-turn-helix domain-containing protein [Actinobacillus genomosp. 2]WGE90259.1 helix-turn-helix domain-containing protein [Actinobacillus arthritidis]
MQIIPNSVNVMDENGIIIASGNPSRLGERHTGAIIVLRNKQAVEIDEHLVKQWNYEAREGFNLPISYLGNIIGVIGISGKPNEVRQYGELVKMAAELIVEQSVLLAQERWQQRYKEEFIRQLLRGNLSEAEVKQQAVFFQLDFCHAPITLMVKINQPDSEKLQRLLNHIEANTRHLALAVVDLDKLVVLMSEDEFNHLYKERNLLSLLPDITRNTEYKIVVGAKVDYFHQVHFSYQTALHTLAYAEKMRLKKQILLFSDYKLPALLADFAQTWQCSELLSPFNALFAQDNKAVLFKSLQQYFLSNCDLAHASEKLFIHPNTLRYRLEKIEEITSLSFNKIEDKFMLYLGASLLK